jgi:molecular chaperone GrpE
MADDTQPQAEDESGQTPDSALDSGPDQNLAEPLEAEPPNGPEPDSPEAAAAIAAQMAALQDQLLRAAAETENVRRRAARDVENAHKFALEKFAGDLLPVVDSLERAVEAAGEVAADAAALAEGVELSLKLFLTVLEKFGVVQLDPLGEPFDPQVHEAIAMVPNPDSEPNSVMEVMQKGYTLNGRVVRAARVVVVSPAGNA